MIIPHARYAVTVCIAAQFLLSPVRAAPIFTNIVDTNSTAPGHGVFTGISPFPSVSGSTVSFVGAYSGGSGIYTGTVGAAGVTKIVDTTNTAPGQGAFVGFGSPWISGSNLAFKGNFAAGNGIFTATVGATGAAKIADTSDTAPGHTAFTTFGNPSISGSNVALAGYYSGGAGIYTGTAGAAGATKIVDTTNTAPGHGVFINFGDPTISGSNVAIQGTYNVGSGLYTEPVGSTGVTKIVDNTDTAPGHSVFTGLYVPLASGANLAFIGNYSSGSGVYTGAVGTAGAVKIVDTTSAAPGHGAYTNFYNLSLSGSDVAFAGAYSGGNGIFLASGGGVSSIVNTGDALFGSTVNSINFGPSGYDNGTIAFAYSLTDGRSGIATATGVPEPSLLPLLVPGATMLLATRRRMRKA